jgi:hypothetical protein
MEVKCDIRQPFLWLISLVSCSGPPSDIFKMGVVSCLRVTGGRMRYLWLLPLFLLSGCYYPPYYYGYGGYPNPNYPYSYGSGYYSSGAQYPSYGNQPAYPYAQQGYYGGPQSGYANPASNDPNNCGTPDEPYPCYGRYR